MKDIGKWIQHKIRDVGTGFENFQIRIAFRESLLPKTVRRTFFRLQQLGVICCMFLK